MSTLFSSKRKDALFALVGVPLIWALLFGAIFVASNIDKLFDPPAYWYGVIDATERRISRYHSELADCRRQMILDQVEYRSADAQTREAIRSTQKALCDSYGKSIESSRQDIAAFQVRLEEVQGLPWFEAALVSAKPIKR